MTSTYSPPHPLPAALPSQIGASINAVRLPTALALLIYSLIFLQRLAVPFGSFQLPLVAVIGSGMVVLFVLQGRVRIPPARIVLFYIPVTLTILLSFLIHRSFSPASLLYLIALYIPYLFVFTPRAGVEQRSALLAFQCGMTIAVVIGMAYWSLALIGIRLIDPFSLVPQQFVQRGYTLPYPIYYGSTILKSNGTFFLEASFLSQFSALAILIELLFFRRISRLILFTAALMTSFSGTGILLLLIFIWPTAMNLPKRVRIAVFIVGFITLLVAVVTPYSSSVFSRVNEFQDPNSSAYARFIAPYNVFDQLSVENPFSIIHGIGAGTVDDLDTPFDAVYPPIPKLVIEYGIFVTMTFVAFILYVYLYRSCSRVLALALLTMNFVLSGGLLQPATVYLSLALTTLYLCHDAQVMSSNTREVSSHAAFRRN